MRLRSVDRLVQMVRVSAASCARPRYRDIKPFGGCALLLVLVLSIGYMNKSLN